MGPGFLLSLLLLGEHGGETLTKSFNTLQVLQLLLIIKVLRSIFSKFYIALT